MEWRFDMANHEIAIGTKVRLMANSEFSLNGKSKFNPVGVDGKVIEPECSGWTSVKWSNGCVNHYRNNAKDLYVARKRK